MVLQQCHHHTLMLLVLVLVLPCSGLATTITAWNNPQTIQQIIQQENITEWRTLTHESGYCALYGICGHRADNDVLSCPINTKAQPLSKTAYTKLQAVCPQLTASAGGPDGRFCCTEEQIDVMARSVGAGVFGGLTHTAGFVQHKRALFFQGLPCTCVYPCTRQHTYVLQSITHTPIHNAHSSTYQVFSLPAAQHVTTTLSTLYACLHAPLIKQGLRM